LAEAEALYRQILAQSPQHPDALHWLGVLACGTGHLEAAIDLIGRAIAVRPDSPEAHCNLGNALRSHGQHDRAIAAYSRAVALRADFAEAYNNLGNALRDKAGSRTRSPPSAGRSRSGPTWPMSRSILAMP